MNTTHPMRHVFAAAFVSLVPLSADAWDPSQGKPSLTVPSLHIRNLGVGADVYDDRPHFTLGGGFELQLTRYDLGVSDDKNGTAHYVRLTTGLDATLHEESESVHGGMRVKLHNDVFGDFRFGVDTVWLPSSEGRLYPWGTLIFGPSLFEELQYPFVWFDVGPGSEHHDRLMWIKGSGGAGFVLTGRTHPRASVCSAPRDDLVRMKEQCKPLSNEIGALVEQTVVGTPKSVFDPNRFRLRLHVGPAGGYWLVRHDHNRRDAEGRKLDEQEPDTSITRGSLLVLVDSVFNVGPVLPILEAKLYIPHEFYAKVGLRIPLHPTVMLVWNILEYRRSRVEEMLGEHVLVPQGHTWKTGAQVEWTPAWWQ